MSWHHTTNRQLTTNNQQLTTNNQQPTGTEPVISSQPHSGRSRPTVQQVLRRYQRTTKQRELFESYASQHVQRWMRNMLRCRTGSLGGHVKRCVSCSSEMAKSNACNLRSCSVCGGSRREAWRERVIGWSLECDHLHIVFTLPHEPNDLMFWPSGFYGHDNKRATFRMLMTTSVETLQRVAEEVYGCRVGLIATIHTWGQRLNRHVHVHVIMTAGGLSLDGSRWVPISADDAAMQAAELAARFKRSYLRRLTGMLKRGVLTWPGESSPMAKSKVLTDDARELIAKIRAKRWIVDVQSTPAYYRGAVGVVNYLSAYVKGTAIGNGRILSDDGRHVQFRIKDYAAGKGVRSTMKLTGEEFLRRYTDHILPKGIHRVRYAGAFTVHQRKQTLPASREKLAEYYREQGIRWPSRQTDDETEKPPAHAKHACKECQGEMKMTVKIGGPAMRRVLTLTMIVVARILNGAKGTIGELCNNLDRDNDRLNERASVRQPFIRLDAEAYHFVDLLVGQHIRAIDAALEQHTEQATDPNAQPPPEAAKEEALAGDGRPQTV